MNINDFAVLVAKCEKGKVQVNIAQIKEILKIIRTIILKRTKKSWDFYRVIRGI